MLRQQRNASLARHSRGTAHHGSFTLDAYAASHRAIEELKSAGRGAHSVGTRSSKYLNNIVEQDHRRIKQRIRPMIGFKRFETATIMISSIELAQKFGNSSSTLETCRADLQLLLMFGQLFSPPERSVVLSNRGRFSARAEFAPEPPIAFLNTHLTTRLDHFR
jgi:hypothetical protein